VLNLWDAYIRAAQVGWDANVVVAMRLMRLAVGGALAQREAQRIAQAQAAAVTKMIMGGGMAAATKSASAVYRRKVRANRRRLTRR
jgi:methyl coenzyme M reductase subunit C